MTFPSKAGTLLGFGLIVVLSFCCIRASAAPQESRSAWKVEQAKSPMDDSLTVTVSRSAEAEISGWPDKKAVPTLVIRHQEGRVEAYIVTGLSAHIDKGTGCDDAKVTLRFDQEPARETSLNRSTSSDALFFSAARRWIKEMLKHERLVFRFTPFNSCPQTTSFDLRGLGDALKPLYEAAAWWPGSCHDRLSDALSIKILVSVLMRRAPHADSEDFDLAVNVTATALATKDYLRSLAIKGVFKDVADAIKDVEVAPCLPPTWGITVTVSKGWIPHGWEDTAIEAVKSAAKESALDARMTLKSDGDGSSDQAIRIEVTGVPNQPAKGG